MSNSKIVLKSTTKLSLNERFSALRKNASGPTAAANIRQKIQQMHQATSRNRRLALQMENRPSVRAALKIKKKTLNQRLGNVQQFRSRGMGGRPRGLQTRGMQTRRGFGGQRRNFGSPSNTAKRGGGGRGRVRQGRGIGNGRGRGAGGSGAGRGQGFRTRDGRKNNARGSFRGGRGQFSGRGRGRGGRGQQKVPSRQQLDIELDQYMAKSKYALDHELDSYMAQAS